MSSEQNEITYRPELDKLIGYNGDIEVEELDFDQIIEEASLSLTKYYMEAGRMDRFADEQLTIRWSASEIDIGKDAETFPKLTPSEQKVIKCILLFFLLGDKVIIKNIDANMMSILPTDDAESFFAIQKSVEVVHVSTYKLVAKAIMTRDEDEFTELLRETQKSKSVRAKIAYGHYWLSREGVSKFERVVSFICNEGIFFFTQFEIISAIKFYTNGMSGLELANSFIRKDELLHRNAGIEIAKILLEKEAFETGQSYEKVRENHRNQFIRVVAGAVKAECEAIKDIFDGVDIKYITEEMMLNEVLCCANDIAVEMGYGKIYDVVRSVKAYATVEKTITSKNNPWERNKTYNLEKTSEDDKRYNFQELASLDI